MAATGDPPTEFWATLPSNQQSDLPPGAHFNPQTCSVSMSLQVAAAAIPGKVYWGRCANGMFVEQLKGRYDPKANPPLASSPAAVARSAPTHAVRARSHARGWRVSMQLVWNSREVRAYLTHSWWRPANQSPSCGSRVSVLYGTDGTCLRQRSWRHE
ncbi:MAG: hypothetical protein DLM70_05960 [Chloroflexi bacterium]|nr:MAG: hypothetical protein DLM70_05960 [Chloroflexota bacterium]